MFEERWDQLLDLSNRIHRKGFDDGIEVIRAGHEIRALTSHELSPRRHLVLAGDKLGDWYAALVDLGDSGQPVRGVRLPGLPRDPEGRARVVDGLTVVPWVGGHGVVAATRGNGAWLVPLEAILDAVGDEPAASAESVAESAIQLEGSADQPVHRLFFDPTSGTLYAGVGTSLLSWSLQDAEPESVLDLALGCQVTALAVDRGRPGAVGVAGDHLYVATNRFLLHRFLRQAEDGPFAIAEPPFADPDGAVWEGRLSIVEHLRPLSDLAWPDGSRLFSQRGVVGASLRHAFVIYDDADDPTERAAFVVRLAVACSKILAICPLVVSRESGRSWYGLAVSTLDQTLRIFRPSGVRSPDGDDHQSFRRDVPEASTPASLLSGYEDLTSLPDRVYAMKPLSDSGGELPVLFGLGDHTVQLRRLRVRWHLRRSARELSERMVDEAGVLDDLLTDLQHRALDSATTDRERRALIELIPPVGARCDSSPRWRELCFLTWDVLGGSRRHGQIPVQMIQALRRLQRLRPDRGQDLEAIVSRIRKYVLDEKSFSSKEGDLIKLARSTDPGLEDDRIIYRSILVSRRVDPLFDRHLPHLGEVSAFGLIPPAGTPPRDLWTLPPRELSFLIGTLRRTLWLMTGTGEAQRLQVPELLGSIRAFQALGDHVYLAFNTGKLRRVERGRLLACRSGDDPSLDLDPVEGAPDDPPSFVTALAAEPAAPGGGEGDAGSLLLGDRNGKIFRIRDGRQLLLFDPSEETAFRYTPGEISQLHEVPDQGTEAAGPRLVIAATTAGDVLLFESRTGGHGGSSLRMIDRLSLAPSPVTALLVAGPDSRHVIVGSSDGQITGLRLVGLRGQESGSASHLRVVWAFRTGAAVRAIRPLDPVQAAAGAGPLHDLVLAGSHDEHLHALDLDGRLLETFFLPGFKVDLFETAPRHPDDPDDEVESRVYGCAFENRLLGLRLVSRRRLLDRLQEELSDLDDVERERRLTRWRAYSIREGHLRHRFIRQSRRYPGPSVEDVLRALERLVETEDSTDLPTGEATALLRRLFQNGSPGTAAAGDAAASPAGLRGILADPVLYTRVLELLERLEERWDAPGSIANRRVQLFWIRSFLRNVESPAMLERWLEIGGEVEAQVPLATPSALLRHFLEHPSELLQFKTLQYLERLLFGWPGVTEPAGLLNMEPTEGSGRPIPLDWLFEGLLGRLRLSPPSGPSAEADPVVLQCGRIFCRLVASRERRHMDPLFLAYKLQQKDLPVSLLRQLADQMDVLVRDEDDASLARVLREAWRLTDAVDRESPLPAIISPLRSLAEHCDLHAGSPDAAFLRDSSSFFNALIPLLETSNLQGITGLSSRWKRPGELRHYPSAVRLEPVVPFLEAVSRYWEVKWEDQFGSARPGRHDPLHALRHEHFHQVRVQLKELHAAFGRRAWDMARSPHPSPLERRMLERLTAHWDRIVGTEQRQDLIQDFIETVNRRCLDPRPDAPRDGREAYSQLREQLALTVQAFRNLFVRLLLFAEPAKAAFLRRRTDLGGGIKVEWLEGEVHEESVVDGTEREAPPWVNAAWLRSETFSTLQEEGLRQHLRASQRDLHWEVQVIPDPSDNPGAFGFYLFGWRSKDDEGARRFREHRVTWALPLHALVYRQAALQQRNMRDRLLTMLAHNLGAPLFQIRSDLGVLTDGLLEAKPEKRRDKYAELLHQARQLDGIFDSITRMRDRVIQVRLAEVSLAGLVYQAVRSVRKKAKVWDISVEFPKPDAESESSTAFLTDETKTYDVVTQILENAVKYSPPRSRVRVGLRVTTHGAEVRITDQGPGIPEEEVPHVFDLYFRGSYAVSHEIPGLGLGMHVAKLYVDALGGRIQVQNLQDGGASFVVFLPPNAPETSPEG